MQIRRNGRSTVAERLSRIAALGLTLLTLAFSPAARAVPINITYTDASGEGFFDPTLGPARRIAFETAAGKWGSLLEGPTPINISASFDPLGGSSGSAVLGSAGAVTVARDFAGAYVAGTWYPAALGNQLSGTDLNASNGDIVARFNSDVDGPVVLGSTSFYYGTDGRGGYHIDFLSVAMHEFGHGLGFFSMVNTDGSLSGGYPAIYDRYLANGSAPTANLIVGLTQTQRAASLVSNSLYFAGYNAQTVGSGLNARIYAPNPFKSGSSISHVDEATYTGINEMMTPMSSGVAHDPGPVATAVFQDIGWSFQVPDTTSQTPAQMAFLVQPGNARMYEPFGQQPQVLVQNAAGQTVVYTGPVTLAWKSGTGATGTVLSGTATVNAVNGKATFTNLSLNRSGTGFVLTATSGSLPAKDSAPFSVAQVPYSVKFLRQPAGATAGVAFSTQPQLVVRDRNGYTVTGFSSPMTLAIRTGTGAVGARLLGTTTVNAVKGIATFTNLAIDLTGTGYQLVPASTTLITYASQPFDVGGTTTAPTAYSVKFIRQPAGAVAGKPFTTQPQLVIRRLDGYTDTTFNGPVTVSIRAGTGTSGAVLLGTRTVNAVNGIATFANLAIDRAGTGYQLMPSSGSLVPYPSVTFTVN